MHSVVTELRHVLRRLARAPLFTAVAVLTLGLGIGANSAIFAVVNGVLLEPLPYDEPDRLVGVWHTAPGAGFEQVELSLATYLTYRAEGTAVFEDVGMWNYAEVAITGLAEPEQVAALRLTESVLPILGVEPLFGRTFTVEDVQVGAPRVVLLAHAYWQRNFGGVRDVIGQTLRISGNEVEIIGVLPPRLRLSGADAALYLPFTIDPSQASTGDFSYNGIARLRPGITVERANAEVDRLIPVSAERYPGGLSLEQLRDAGFVANVHAYKQDIIGDIGSVLWVLLGAVGLLLLIACANVANLFLVRAESRTREIAVRVAMGASGRRLAREFLSESLVLGLFGGLAGTALAAAGTALLIRIAPRTLPRIEEIAIDPRVLLFTLALSILAGLLFGALPLLRFHAPQLVSALREGGRGASTGRDRHRARNALVIAQVALALVLLVGSGLLLRTFAELRNVHPGFLAPARVLTVGVSIPGAEIRDDIAAARAHEQILERIAAIPGVSAVGAASTLPMTGQNSNDIVEMQAFPTPEGALPPVRRITFVAPGYFQTLGSPLIAGRTIEWADVHDQRSVVVISENLARMFWSDPADALGQRLRASLTTDWFEIVGVHEDIRIDGVDRDAPVAIYFPMVVRNLWGNPLIVRRALSYTIRFDGPAVTSIVPAVREAVRHVHPNLPLANVRTLAQIADRSMARTSFALVLLAIAAVVALVLGAIGVYGVLSYVVSQRTREIGVRVALGARTADVRHLVLRQGLFITTLGLAFGLTAAIALTRLMTSMLFGVSPLDIPTFGLVAATIATIALAASAIPAWRAARLDPVDALRRD
jgi:predicted permease